MKSISRRKVLESGIANVVVVAATLGLPPMRLRAQEAGAGQLAPTGEEALGPFYKKGAPNVRVLRQASEPGFPLRISGKVIALDGKPLTGASVELWHADFYGLYDIKGYRYRARLQPDRFGGYAVETIMPGHYPDRPAQHIHYLVSAPGHKTLVTQAYFATDPYFEGDPDRNPGLVSYPDNIRPVILYESANGGAAEVTFDLVLEPA